MSHHLEKLAVAINHLNDAIAVLANSQKVDEDKMRHIDTASEAARELANDVLVLLHNPPHSQRGVG